MRTLLEATLCRLFGHWAKVLYEPMSIRNRLYRCRLCGAVWWDSTTPMPREESDAIVGVLVVALCQEAGRGDERDT